MKTSNFSGGGGGPAKVRAARGAARAGELSVSARVSGWRSIFCSKHHNFTINDTQLVWPFKHKPRTMIDG